MKILIFSILVLFMAGCAVSKLPPSQSKEMIEQADRIILVIESSPDESYKKIGQYLTDLGFAIYNSDPQLLTIQTNYKTFGIAQGGGLWRFTIRINTSVRDSSIHFYGQTGNAILGEYEIENRGSSKSWEKLVEIAKGFPHKEIYYSRN